MIFAIVYTTGSDRSIHGGERSRRATPDERDCQRRVDVGRRQVAILRAQRIDAVILAGAMRDPSVLDTFRSVGTLVAGPSARIRLPRIDRPAFGGCRPAFGGDCGNIVTCGR
jgi:hypothetical protein